MSAKTFTSNLDDFETTWATNDKPVKLGHLVTVLVFVRCQS